MIATKLPTTHQRLQVSVTAMVNPKTVLRCYQSLPVRETVALRICKAARDLRIPEPAVVLAK